MAREPRDPNLGRPPGARRGAKCGSPKRRIAYSLKLAIAICEQISDGRTLKEVCAQSGMPKRSAAFAWLSEHPEFAELYARAREERADLIADEIVSIADKERDPNKARVRIDARKWWAAKVNAKKYGDKTSVDLVSENRNRHEHSIDENSPFADFLREALASADERAKDREEAGAKIPGATRSTD